MTRQHIEYTQHVNSMENNYNLHISIIQVNSALHPPRVAKSSTSFGWGKGGKVTAAWWQVTLCDPVWHEISSCLRWFRLRTDKSVYLLFKRKQNTVKLKWECNGSIWAKITTEIPDTDIRFRLADIQPFFAIRFQLRQKYWLIPDSAIG